MKNKFGIITIILISLGIIIIGISLTLVGFDIRKFGLDENYKQVTYEIDSEKIEKITFKNVDRKIRIENSLDNNVHIIYYNNEKIKETYEITLENNILQLRKKTAFLIMQLNTLEFFPTKNVDIIVQIPENSNIIVEK